jgi:hypothetical protein
MPFPLSIYVINIALLMITPKIIEDGVVNNMPTKRFLCMLPPHCLSNEHIVLACVAPLQILAKGGM